MTLFFLLSCGDRTTVDKDYLESEKYREFSEKQSQEYTLRLEDYRSLKKYLAEFSQCELGKELDYPLQIDNRVLRQEFSTCEKVDDKYNTSFKIRSFGYSSFNDVIVRWIIVQKESVYEDTELYAATYRDDSLVSFQNVGVFRDNLQQDISTDIEIAEKQGFLLLRSSMDRGIKYPLKYDNVIQRTFQIDRSGHIEERTEEATSYQSLPKYLEESNSCAMEKQWTIPVQINNDFLDNHSTPCETDIYNTNFTARSIGYTKFNDLIIRLFNMKRNTHNRDQMLMAAVYNDSSLISFQSIGTFQSFSPDFTTDLNISSDIEMYREGDEVRILSSITRDRSFPIKQQTSTTLQYNIDTDGNIREI